MTPTFTRAIVVVPDPILRQVAHRVEEFGTPASNLAHELTAVMHSAHGIGLAAPQIGISLRMIVVAPDGFEPLVMCNPDIVRERGEQTGEEGCLSIPGKKVRITRAYEVRVSYQTPAGLRRTMKAKDLRARAIQHEIDHLNGVLITDYEEAR